MELCEAIQFTNQTIGGAASIKFPSFTGCPACGGITGFVITDEQGNQTIVKDAELAAKVELVKLGYNLAWNHQAAARGSFAGFDGHEARPDSWQCVEESKPCTCPVAVQVRKEAA
jgi:hypothetical protein